ncbi:MAG: putative Ig domain-containing protein, partial [Acidobacteriota bacterium]
ANFTIRVTGFGACQQTRAYTLPISGSCGPFIWPNLSDTTVGAFYYSVVIPLGSTEVQLTTGSLPPGLTFIYPGVIYGTPTQAGTFNFTLTSNIAGCASSHNYSLVVRPPGKQ